MADYAASDVPREKRATANANPGNVAGTIYVLAFIGAVIYFIQTATSFWEGALGILKAIVWPAILIYEFFSFLKL